MLILKIYRFFKGKLKVAFSGDFVERVLNLCAYNGISVWGIRKRGDNLTLFMSVNDWKQMPKILRNTGVRAHILKKYGVPIIIGRYRYRYGIALGALLFFVVLQILSGYIWNISVVGNDKIKSETIIAACESIGIKEGIRASKIDALDKRVELQTRVDSLAWAALNIEGCLLTVDVKEASLTPQKDYSPCNLVASDDGVIKKIEVTEGQIKVALGDAVTENTLLVSGFYELANGSTNLVKSSGEIVAEMVEKHTITVPFRQKIKHFTGRQKQKYVLQFFSLKIPLYLGEERGDFQKHTKKIILKNENSYVPVFLHKIYLREIKENSVLLSEERAEQIAKKELEKRLKNAKIIKMAENKTITEDALILNCEVTLQKNIAVTEKILFGTTNQ